MGIYFSKTILSIFPYVLLLTGFFNGDIKKRLKKFFTTPYMIALPSILLLYILSGINSSDTSLWLGRVNTNLIYLIIPLAVYLNGPYPEKFIDKVLAVFVILNTVINAWLLVNYIVDYQDTNSKYLQGQTIATPVIHVRYSYFVAISVIFAVYLYLKKFKFKYRFEPYLYGFSALFSLIFLHILAVRTGLVALYITAVFWAIFYSIKKKKPKPAIIIITAIISLGTFSYFFVPSFQNKIKYVAWDIKSTLDNSSKHHTSDRIRIYSIINGIKLWKESPVLGTGIGDIEKKMDEKYQINYPSLPRNMRFTPINQFVFILASMGTVGFVLFFGLLLYPLFALKQKHELLVIFYVLTFATFLGETTIELMIGKTTFLTLVSLFLFYKKPNQKIISRSR